MPAGRPTDYTPDLASDICRRLAAGESMRSVCRDDDKPCMSSVFNWLRDIPEFMAQYDRAKVESADALVEDMLDIADNQVAQPLIVDGKPLEVDGKIVMIADSVGVQHARLRVDTRKWAASKLKPKKYGDRQELHVIKTYQDMDDEELAQSIKRLEQLRESSTED